MSDREFIVELRRGLMIIMRALVRRYGLSWADFLPREQTVTFIGFPVVIDETLK